MPGALPRIWRRRASLRATPPTVFLIAGEPSGDAIGARLMRALRDQYKSPVHFEGVGGEAMESEGLSSLFPMGELTVAGFAEVVPSLPRLAVRLFQTVRAVEAARPSVVVGIDSKGFNLRVLRALARRRGAPSALHPPSAPIALAPPLAERSPALVQYVGPSAWAFSDAEKRAAGLRGWLDRLLVLLPFEEALFSGSGVPCSFVGHPALEHALDEQADTSADRAARRAVAAEAFRRAHSLGSSRVVCLLPGSRPQEVRAMLPTLLRGSERTAALHGPGTCFVILAAPGVGDLVRQIASQVLGSIGRPQRGVSGHASSDGCGRSLRCVVVDADARDGAFACASLALAACGTVNIELAAAGVPQIAVFRTSWLTEWVIRKWIRPTIRHTALPNIVAGRQLVPELLFEQCTPDRIAEEACFALANPSLVAAEAEQLRRLVLPSMHARDAHGRPVPASQAAARALLPYLPAPND